MQCLCFYSLTLMFILDDSEIYLSGWKGEFRLSECQSFKTFFLCHWCCGKNKLECFSLSSFIWRPKTIQGGHHVVPLSMLWPLASPGNIRLVGKTTKLISLGWILVFHSEGLYHKTYYSRNLLIFRIKIVFVPGKPFQPS